MRMWEGMTPGSMPLSTSIFQEGLIIPALKLVEKGTIDKKIMSFLLNNVRTPVEREGDFAAQIMANITGVRRTEELIAKYSIEKTRFYAGALMDYAERLTRRTIREIPDGVYTFEDFMDDDGISDGNIKLQVKITIYNDTATLDFRECDLQVHGSINAVYAITLSAVLLFFVLWFQQTFPPMPDV